MTVVADGQCSLHEAVANALDTIDGTVYSDCAAGDPAAEDIVQLAVSGSYLFPDNAAFVTVNGAVTIEGNNATLDHNANAFFFLSGVNSHLTLRNITLQGSYGTVSAISGSGSLHMVDSVMRDNVNTGTGGGAITFSGSHTVQRLFDNVTFENNVGDQYGGVIRITGGNPAAQLEIRDSSLRNNGSSTVAPISMYSDFGGVIRSSSTSPDEPINIIIANSTFANNVAQSGGALSIGANSFVTITHSTFDDNRAFSNGGAIFIAQGQVDIKASTVSNNLADSVTGGITYGGGIANTRGTVTLHSSTLSGNSADIGGAISNRSTYASDNHSLVELDFVTVAFNNATAGSGGAFHNYAVNNSVSTITLRNNLIDKNTASTQGDFTCNNQGGTFVSQGYNVITGSALNGCTQIASDIYAHGSVIHVETALADNGGKTFTHAIPLSSYAHNAIPGGVNGCDSAVLDQRDLRRQSGTEPLSCDVGAYEYGASAPPTVVRLAGQTSVDNGTWSLIGALLFLILLSSRSLLPKQDET